MFLRIVSASFRLLAAVAFLVVAVAVTGSIYAFANKPAEAAQTVSAEYNDTLQQQSAKIAKQLEQLRRTYVKKPKAQPVSRPGRYVTAVSASNQLTGHANYCERFPEECRPIQETGPVLLKQQNLDSLNAVNSWVNQRIVPVIDMDLYNTEEWWSDPRSTLEVGAGDCEDLAFLKRQILIDRGWPASVLLITMVSIPGVDDDKDGQDDGHAVLTVRGQNSRGPIDLVLDNRKDEILTPGETGYTFLKRTSPRHAGEWEDLATVGATQ